MPAIAPGIRGQTHLDDFLDFSGTIAVSGVAQLVLGQQPGRTSLFIVNSSAADVITLGIGPATATATLTSKTVSSIAVANAGVGYTVVPQVVILGGVYPGDLRTTPQHPATAHALLSGTGIGSIVVDDPGAGYNVVPYIYLMNPLPQLGGGAFLPSATAGIALPAGFSFSTSGMIIVPTSAVAIYGPNNTDTYVIKVGGLV